MNGEVTPLPNIVKEKIRIGIKKTETDSYLMLKKGEVKMFRHKCV